ncbi:gliding motility-associated ABC transporter ATP-binding subunit GldA [Namhaeicola litoreus]|uniref:Gliding motility-associated ABC transporter ATP-binding subunit GldA n=1 Tax=Namhaeicola litoreus TaxID=1052145 RepID=A0ABW3Y446_9FLAO
MSIKVVNTTKIYGKQKAINQLSFTVKSGEIVGFLGPNGAGKSTTMKIITSYIAPSEGQVFINDLNVQTHPIDAKRNVGYLPEHNPLYLDMYVREYLAFHADVHEIPKSRIDEVIDLVGITPESSKKIGQLSKGYRQRVGLAAAILHDPQVLILDEPTTGLDPNQLVGIRDLIKKIGKKKTILLSTHIMQEVEAMCDRVIIISKGEIVADKKLNDLLGNQKQIIEVEFNTRIENRFLEQIERIIQVENIFDNQWLLTFDSENDMRGKIFDFANENGLKILHLSRKIKNLESLFQELTH